MANRHPTIQDLFPGQTPEWYGEAEANLRRYLQTVSETYRRGDSAGRARINRTNRHYQPLSPELTAEVETEQKAEDERRRQRFDRIADDLKRLDEAFARLERIEQLCGDEWLPPGITKGQRPYGDSNAKEAQRSRSLP